ncbi:MAG: hypothetical protein KGQ46_12350 [Hyphomicrobiales bacterium]|nr:hypothetical protein [Hyphomicrobiales bacterium]MDE2113849.1 hypothetical protein [Hyphomicrobiales bacterium]
MIGSLDDLSRDELLILARRGAPSPASIAHLQHEHLLTRTHAAYGRWQASSAAASAGAKRARLLANHDHFGPRFSTALASANALLAIAKTDWLIYRRAKAKSDQALRAAVRLGREEGEV